jgi:hypothetical protein
MKKFGLFLDDERNPKDITWIDYPPDISWSIVRTVEEFKSVINTSLYSFDSKELPIISFDNDLATKLEGRDAARFLCDECSCHNLPLPTCFIHSQNNQAVDSIKSILESYTKVYNEKNNIEIKLLPETEY